MWRDLLFVLLIVGICCLAYWLQEPPPIADPAVPPVTKTLKQIDAELADITAEMEAFKAGRPADPELWEEADRWEFQQLSARKLELLGERGNLFDQQDGER